MSVYSGIVGGFIHAGLEHFGCDPDCHPLVVIDPEDRPTVERLRDLYDVAVIQQNGDPDPRDVTPGDGNALQASLREFANPASPKPDEPTRTGWLRVRWNRFKGRHDDGTRHDWSHGRRTGTGWGVVRCLKCGLEDIY